MTNPSWRMHRRAFAACAIGLMIVASPLAAQMLGVPVLQNSFANPGITVAGNFGAQDGAWGYGGAASWSPGSGRFQLSGGAGVFDVDVDGGHERTLTWGARGSFSFLSLAGGSIGVGAFAGVGGASKDGVTELRVPVGASAGWRRPIGETRAISVYVAPFYSYAERRFDQSGIDCDVEDCDTERKGTVRVSAGVDFALARSIGITVGYEDGQRAKGADPGPRSGIFGVGVSYAFKRGQ